MIRTTRLQAVLLVTGSLALTLIAAEVTLRLLFREEEVNGNYWGRGAFEPFPGAGYRHAEGFRGYAVRPGAFVSPVAIDRLGLRQSDLASQLAYPGRLLLLGDSYTFGLGVPEEATFAHLLEPTLNPEGIGVINGGQTGYAANQEAAFGRWLGERIDPTLILQCLFVENDVFEDYTRGFERIAIRYGYRLPSGRRPKGPISDYLRTHSYVWLFVGGRINAFRARLTWRGFRQLSRSEPASVIEPTLEAVAVLRRFAEVHGSRFAVVMVARPGVTNRFTAPVRRRLEADGVAVLDLEQKELDLDDRFAADGHWNESGHRKAALYIREFVETLGWTTDLAGRRSQGLERAGQPIGYDGAASPQSLPLMAGSPPIG